MIVEPIVESTKAAVPGAVLEIVQNPSPSEQHSIIVDAVHAVEVAMYLRDAAGLEFDYCSNVTGVDWMPKETSTSVKVKKLVDGVEQDISEVQKTTTPGYLEVVYHLFSIALRHGPLVLRMRTVDRDADTHLPSLTPVWRSAEFQEREAFDLYGIVFDGHPDLRRILMWDGFVDYPMRKDYVPPPDDAVLPEVHS